MVLRFVAIIVAIFGLNIGSAQNRFAAIVDNIQYNPAYSSAAIGIHVVDVKSGKTIYGINEHQRFVPASVMKLITSATALEILGPVYRFRTSIGYTGSLKNGVLKGNLVVKGGGDPSLGSEFFTCNDYATSFMEAWLMRIKSAGINLVDGNLVLDASIYDDELIPGTWIWKDIGNYYGAGASAFTLNDNIYRITFKSQAKAGKPTEIVAIQPPIEELDVENKVLSSDINRDLAFIYGSPLDKSRQVRGTIPKNKKAFTIKGSILQPEFHFANTLIEYLAQNGVFVTGSIIFDSASDAKVVQLYEQESPTLAEIVEVLNHESVNLFAEHLLKQLSVVESGQGTYGESLEIVSRFWNDKIPEPFFMEDGSGLSHFNAVSPAVFTTILAYMNNQSRYTHAFKNSLPVAGEGTLSSFNRVLFPGNSLRAKSGSMTRVRCYAGYLTTKQNKELAFCFMFNHFDGGSSALVQKIEQLLAALSNGE